MAAPRLDIRRLFFALWPSDDMRRKIQEDTQELARRSGGRLIPPANFHVTVAFVGEVLAERIDAAVRAGAQTTAHSFDLSLDRVESWPGSNVLCLTAQQTPPGLIVLADQLRFSLLAQQFKLRRQVFRPHVTLVRDLPRMRASESIVPFRWSVADFVLIDSKVSKGGSQYVILARWPLSPTPS